MVTSFAPPTSPDARCALCGEAPSESECLALACRNLTAMMVQLVAIGSLKERRGERVLLSVEDTAALLGCSRTAVFQYLREGMLEGRKLGKQRMVTRRSVEALAAGEAPARRRARRKTRTVSADGEALAAEVASLDV